MLDPITREELRRRIDVERRAQAGLTECLHGDAGRRGTHLGYTAGCRCPDCKDGHAAYRRERRRLLRELEP